MASSFFSTVILIGAVQGLIMSFLLFSMKVNRLPARSLAWLLILIAVASLNIWSWSVESWQSSRLYAILTECLPLIVIMPVGPLIRLYVQSTLTPSMKFTRREKLHFFPVLIDLVPSLVATTYLLIIVSGSDKNYGPAVSKFIDTYNVYSDIPRWFSISYYCWVSITLLKQQNNEIIERQPDNISWLRQFLGIFTGFQVLWFFYLVPYVIPEYTDWVLDNIGWYPIYVPLALLIYVFGTHGYLQVKQLREIQKKELIPLFTDNEAKENIAVLVKAMEERKLYLDPTLNLARLSADTGIPAKQVSAVLNQHLLKSFSEFINGYRVSEVINRLSAPGSEKLTIAGLAYECGFNSQPTFQRSFKAITGKTPSQYIRSGAALA